MEDKCIRSHAIDMEIQRRILTGYRLVDDHIEIVDPKAVATVARLGNYTFHEASIVLMLILEEWTDNQNFLNRPLPDTLLPRIDKLIEKARLRAEAAARSK